MNEQNEDQQEPVREIKEMELFYINVHLLDEDEEENES